MGTLPHSSTLDERAKNEIQRSAAEARDLVLHSVEIDRYLDPPTDTAYPLEYAYNLLGNIRGKVVLDFGCGSGENLIPLIRRGAHVIGIDISPDLIDLAKRRVQDAQMVADLRVRSAYETELPDHSVDVIFCMALIHHLEIPRVQAEMARILSAGGYIVVQEPIRFSKFYNRLRGILPAPTNVSDYEHPLTADEFKVLSQKYFISSNTRFFRLPFVPLVNRFSPRVPNWVFRLSNWLQ
jgi:2-polyprenyl-3-methyl-5-hydroxy-6-metoxy-1,4-benzoquinol methylase